MFTTAGCAVNVCDPTAKPITLKVATPAALVLTVPMGDPLSMKATGVTYAGVIVAVNVSESPKTKLEAFAVRTVEPGICVGGGEATGMGPRVPGV